jgi:hypothetical protein
MIINTIKKWYTGGGSSTVYFANQNFNISNGNTTISCPVGGNIQTNQVGGGPVTVGYVRVKTEAAGNFINTGNVYANASVARVIAIVGDDGNSNQVLLYAGDTNVALPNVGIDCIYEWSCDLQLTNVNVIINVSNVNATGNAVMSVEVAAGP